MEKAPQRARGNSSMKINSIAEQFFQLFARGGFAGIDFRFRFPRAAGEFKIFAEISRRFFQNRFRAAFAALLRDAAVVARAIQTHAQIRAAFHADFAATGIARQRPRLAAVVTMSVHLNLRFAICELRLAKQYPRKSYIVNRKLIVRCA
jgi:hypothetical protein